MTGEPHSDKTTRRDFLARTALAAGAVAAASFLGYRFRSQPGPESAGGETELQHLPDFSIPGLGGRLAIVTGTDRRKGVRRAIEAFGGIGAFIKSGDRVLLKVNAAFSTPPSLGATSHPDIVSEVVRACLEAGATSVIVTDNPVHDAERCFDLTGIARAAADAGARVKVPKPGDFVPFTLAGGTLIKNLPLLLRPFDGVTKLIGLAPVKNHNRAGASMIMKNWYGLLGGRRSVYHQDIHNIVKELALLVRPTLVILDGTMTMISNGPTGGSLSDLKPTNTILAGTDQVAVDAAGATLLGMKASDLPYITKAAAAGVGTANYELLNPIRCSI